MSVVSYNLPWDKVCWVYKLYYKDKLLYIDVSKNILKSVLFQWASMVFDKVTYKTMEYNEAKKLANEQIALHKPSMNDTKTTDWHEDLDDFFKKWNTLSDDIKIDGRKMPWLKRCNKVTEDIKKAFLKVWKTYWYADMLIWADNYYQDLHKRKRDMKAIDGWYASHRFSLYKFLKQDNGIVDFINL